MDAGRVLSQFVEGVESITQDGDTHTHWVVKVGRVKREFDAEITEQIADRVIGWSQTGGDTEGHIGRVEFAALSDTATRIEIELGWAPDGLIEKVGAALDVDQRQVEKSASQFKDFIEAVSADPVDPAEDPTDDASVCPGADPTDGPVINPTLGRSQ